MIISASSSNCGEALICVWVRKYPNITDKADKEPRQPDSIETAVKFLMVVAIILIIYRNVLPSAPFGWLEWAKKDSLMVKLGIHTPPRAKEWEGILQRRKLNDKEEERVVRKGVAIVRG